MGWPNPTCAPCMNGQCTGPGSGGTCEHECHRPPDPEGVPSSGGKKFTIQRNGYEVQMAWVDEVVRHASGDALFTSEDAISLGEELILTGKEIQRKGEEA